MKYLAVIPARGGSKGIKNKNRKLLCGKPLIQYTIEAVQQSIIKDFVVSTDDKNIAKIAEKLGVNVVMRPKELAQDNTPTLPVLQHALKESGSNYDAIITLQPTSPLRKALHINEAIKLFELNKGADSLVSIVKVPHNMVPESIMAIDDGELVNYIESTPLRRQDKPTYYARNGAAIYITTINQLEISVFGGKIIPYEMSFLDSFDIDDIEDWELVQRLI
ncbi:MAG: acylneuraminate cytidylyltransferase family protein [Candidatus Margulisiibacteriota bacterium]